MNLLLAFALAAAAADKPANPLAGVWRQTGIYECGREQAWNSGEEIGRLELGEDRSAAFGAWKGRYGFELTGASFSMKVRGGSRRLAAAGTFQLDGDTLTLRGFDLGLRPKGAVPEKACGYRFARVP